MSGAFAAGEAAAPGDAAADGLALIPGDGEAEGLATAAAADGLLGGAGLVAGFAALAVVGAAAGALVGAAGAADVQLTSSQMPSSPAIRRARFSFIYRAWAGCGVGAAYGFGAAPTSGRKERSIISKVRSRSRSHGSVPTIWLMTVGLLYRPIS